MKGKPWIFWALVILAFLLLITAWGSFILLSRKYSPATVPMEETRLILPCVTFTHPTIAAS